MARPEIRQGDIFCSSSKTGVISKLINACQWFWSIDGEATYSHSGIITTHSGTTVEALWNGVRKDNLFTRYAGSQVIIGRMVGCTEEDFFSGYQRILKYMGKEYPYWRLALHIIPPLAKFFHTIDIPVCSELTWTFVGKGEPWGITPDIVADRIRNWDLFEVVFEGEL